MTISLRLDEQLRHALEEVAHLEGVSKSDVLRRTLREFLARRTTRRLPWELGQHLFGRRGSGRSDLSRNRKRLVREKVDTRNVAGRPMVLLDRTASVDNEFPIYSFRDRSTFRSVFAAAP